MSIAQFDAACSRKARHNLNKWGIQSKIVLGLCIAEESGEVAKAILQYEFENKPFNRIEKELQDLEALILQLYMVLEKEKTT